MTYAIIGEGLMGATLAAIIGEGLTGATLARLSPPRTFPSSSPTRAAPKRSTNSPQGSGHASRLYRLPNAKAWPNLAADWREIAGRWWIESNVSNPLAACDLLESRREAGLKRLNLSNDFVGVEEAENLVRIHPAAILEDRSRGSALAIPFRGQTRYDGELETFLVEP
jgi:hypothetical protein